MKTKIFFKKLEYRFLVESTKIENTSFPFKTAPSEANVKTKRMATSEWTYHKEWSFTSNHFIFLEKIFLKTKTFFKKLEYRFLVETTKIENTSFPFKTTLFFWKHIFWKTRKFETNFLENKNLFQKTGVPFFFETTKIENTSFPFKTTLSEAIVKTTRMETTK